MELGAKNISKWFGGNRALDSIDFAVRSGEVVGLLGDNGAGKSTLIKIIAGAIGADEGTVYVDNKPVAFQSPFDARRAGIETIYQDLALAPNLTVAENVFLGLELRRRRVFGLIRTLDRQAMRKEARGAIDDLSVRIDDVGRKVEGLSGGQRQGVALARAVYWDAKVMIMDEPTGALGVPQQRRVLEIINTLRERGVGVVLISHNLNQVLSVADRVVVLRRGRVAGELAAREASEHAIVALMVGS